MTQALADHSASRKPPRPPTPRMRARATTIERAKAIALRQLADGGVEALSLNQIAAELGLTGPAIYRYFTTRNELLTELIVDAYSDLSAAMEETPRKAGTPAGAAQLRALAEAYRAWALGQPHRYRLLFSAPMPGYDANAARLVEAADRAMAIYLEAIARAGIFSPEKSVGQSLASQLRDWSRKHQRELAPDILYLGLITWTRLHGFISLEIEGAFASMGIDPDAMFKREVDALIGDRRAIRPSR